MVSVCLFTFEVLFKRLFSPTSRSRMSKIFRAFESLGKSNVQKWSQIWTFLFGSGLKWMRDLWSKGISLDVFEFLRFGWFFRFFKKIGFLAILGPPYRGIGASIRIGQEMLCLPYAGFLLVQYPPPSPLNCLSCFVSPFTKTFLHLLLKLAIEHHNKGFIIPTFSRFWSGRRPSGI